VRLFVYHVILSKVELSLLKRMAGTTRLELATSAVTVAAYKYFLDHQEMRKRDRLCLGKANWR
jgi:hypothetical protein